MAAENLADSEENAIIVIEDGEIDDDDDEGHELQVKPCPIFEVIFRTDEFFQKYGDTLLKVLKQHLEIYGKHLEFSTVLNDNLDKSFVARIEAFEPTDCTEFESKQEKPISIEEDAKSDQNSNDSTDFGADLNKLFTIDPSPSTSLESARVPSYKRAIKDFLDDKIEETPINSEDICRRPKPNAACFNCGALDHGLRDCYLPRCAQRINRAKRARTQKGERYHVDVDQRFAHLRPGVITETLQKALRLRSGEIPSFFYRMRVCGYPPGWLEDAKDSNSGLTMFNSGDDVLKSEECNESESDIKYNISKIIEFPGFNVSPGNSFYDDYKHYNVPPLSQCYMKEEMISALGDSAIKGIKRTKLKNDLNPSNEIFDVQNTIVAEPHDMDIDDNDVILPENVQFVRPMPPPLPINNEAIDCSQPLPPPESDDPTPSGSRSPSDSLPLDNDRADSPTLAELQERQRALLQKLECGDDSHNDNELQFDNGNGNLMDIPATPNTPFTPVTPSTPVPCDSDLKKIIKSSHMGTPVLQFSPFEKLPSGDNFKLGVSDVINFENLPDSTGKYEAMKDVLKKVRNIKKQLTDEDD